MDAAEADVSANGSNQQAIDQIRESGNRLRGRLFSLIEASGMAEQQTEAVKRLIRELSYDAQRDLEAIIRGKGH